MMYLGVVLSSLVVLGCQAPVPLLALGFQRLLGCIWWVRVSFRCVLRVLVWVWVFIVWPCLFFVIICIVPWVLVVGWRSSMCIICCPVWFVFCLVCIFMFYLFVVIVRCGIGCWWVWVVYPRWLRMCL